MDVPALEEAGVEGRVEVVEFPGRIDPGRDRDLVAGEKVRPRRGVGASRDRQAQVAADLALRAARPDARHPEDVDIPVELAGGGAGQRPAEIGVLVELQDVERIGLIGLVPDNGEGGAEEGRRRQEQGEGRPVLFQEVEGPGPEQEHGEAGEAAAAGRTAETAARIPAARARARKSRG